MHFNSVNIYLAWPPTLKLYDLVGAGEMESFTTALDALSDTSPEQLTFLHPLSVRVTSIISDFVNEWSIFVCMYVCMYVGRIFTPCPLRKRSGRRCNCCYEESGECQPSTQQGCYLLFCELWFLFFSKSTSIIFFSNYFFFSTFWTILEWADPPWCGPRDEQCRYRVFVAPMEFLL